MNSKAREALEEVVSILSTWTDHLPPGIQEKAQEAIDKAEAALAGPLKNCEVGTPEEQGERCLAQYEQWRKGGGKKLIVAIMEWAHMPYESDVR